MYPSPTGNTPHLPRSWQLMVLSLLLLIASWLNLTLGALSTSKPDLF